MFIGPVFTRQPSHTFVIKNGMAELMCEATGIEPLKYKWYHNGKRVESFARKRILRNGHLYIKRVIHKKRKGYSDTGRYYCTVTDNNGQISTSRTVNLTIGCKYEQTFQRRQSLHFYITYCLF